MLGVTELAGVDPAVVPAGSTPPLPPLSTPVTIPHIRWPFVFTATTSLAVDEQDSLNEIVSSAGVIAQCPIGGWTTNPLFGIPNELFSSAPVNTRMIVNAIQRWEPRAQIAATEAPDALSDATRRVQLFVGNASN